MPATNGVAELVPLNARRAAAPVFPAVSGTTVENTSAGAQMSTLLP